MREKFQSKQTVTVLGKMNTVPKATKLSITSSTFVSPIYTFSMTGKIIVYTAFQGAKREKNFNLSIYQGRMPTLAVNKHLSVYFFFHRRCLFPSFDGKEYGSNPSETGMKLVITAPTQKK